MDRDGCTDRDGAPAALGVVAAEVGAPWSIAVLDSEGRYVVVRKAHLPETSARHVGCRDVSAPCGFAF